MLFSTLSSYFQTIEKTDSRLDITQQLAKLFNEVEADQIDQVCYLALGILAPKFVGLELQLAEKMMQRAVAVALYVPLDEVNQAFKTTGDLGEAFQQLAQAHPEKITDKKLTVAEIYTCMLKIAKESGSGSQERKLQQMISLLQAVDSVSGKYLVRIPVGKLRLGFSDMTILDGLSWMATGNKSLRPQLEHAFNIRADIGQVATIFKQDGLEGVTAMIPEPGVPIRPARATPLISIDEIMEKMSGKAALEPKFDGFRVQIHVDKTKTMNNPDGELSLFEQEQKPFVQIFSRNLDNITYMFPDLVKVAQALPVESVILDGEAVAVDPKTGVILDFQETVKRKRKHGIEAASEQLPLRAYLFDLLYLNGQSYLQESLEKRRQELERVITHPNTLVLASQTIVNNKDDFEDYFQEQAEAGMEGVMVKKVNASYRAGARDFTWVKYKVGMQSELADTVDVVVMGYFIGQGKWTQFGLGKVLVGVPEADTFLSLSKVGSGFSEEKIVEMVKRCQQLKVTEKPKQYQVDPKLIPDVWVEPQMVIELRADSISRSPKYTTGLSLRFPRFIRFRDDKDVTEATSLAQIKQLSLKQKK